MNFIDSLGLIAGTLTTIAFLPQLLRVWQTKSAQDISWGMLIVFSLGLLLWLIYGLYLSALPVILSNFITLILNLVILSLKIRYR